MNRNDSQAAGPVHHGTHCPIHHRSHCPIHHGSHCPIQHGSHCPIQHGSHLPVASAGLCRSVGPCLTALPSSVVGAGGLAGPHRVGARRHRPAHPRRPAQAERPHRAGLPLSGAPPTRPPSMRTRGVTDCSTAPYSDVARGMQPCCKGTPLSTWPAMAVTVGTIAMEPP